MSQSYFGCKIREIDLNMTFGLRETAFIKYLSMVVNESKVNTVIVIKLYTI